ncbi:DMT family transporter [Actinobaculum sp. 352]|uniref:DMT family transporter n=1 Tax=Actinobaculum sp. 352 TaxID=2490946 RepID=UPI000F7ED085|nr:DMT family transporter [Actinobaculum sp. 352]RTE49184.1 hypothetical protein EKN07_06290 [Actinobaculum sp. 352]
MRHHPAYRMRARYLNLLLLLCVCLTGATGFDGLSAPGAEATRAGSPLSTAAVTRAEIAALPSSKAAAGGDGTSVPEVPAGVEDLKAQGVESAKAQGVEAVTLERQHVVVILTGGLRWDQLDGDLTPELSAYAASGIMSNLVPLATRGAACPVDSWLAMSAGRQISPRALATRATCPRPTVFRGFPIQSWEAYEDALAATSSEGSLGTFGAILAEEGVSTQPIGTGAAFVLANPDGTAPRNYQVAPTSNMELAALVSSSASQYDLTIVDADAESYASDDERQAARIADFLEIEQRRAAGQDPDTTEGGSENPPDVVDGSTLTPQRRIYSAINTRRVEAILRDLPAGTRVLVASVVDIDTTSYMQLLVAADVPSAEASGTDDMALVPGLGWSESVRQDGVVQLADLDPTILSWLGITDHNIASGTPMSTVNPVAVPCSPDQACYTDRLSELDDQALHSGKIRTWRGRFVHWLTTAAIVYFLASLVLLAAPVYRRTLRFRWLREAWMLAGLTVAAVPLASFIVDMLHWWNTDSAELALVGGSWLLAGGIGVIALNFQRLWLPAPLVVIAGVTAASLTVDAALGSRVMADSPIGFNLLTAARFYGVGNEAYALIAAGTLIGLAFLGTWIRDRGVGVFRGKWAAVLTVGAIGLVVAAIDALPSLGADFGGVLSFLPALIVLVLLIAQTRISVGRVLGIVVVTGGIAAALAIVDWLRPAESRTHLGRFVQFIIDGELTDVISRKLATNIRLLFASTHRWVVLTALLLLFLALFQTLRRRPALGVDGKAIDQKWRPAWWNGARNWCVNMWGWLGPVQRVARADQTSEAEPMGSTAQTVGAVERVTSVDKVDAVRGVSVDAAGGAPADKSTSTGVRGFDLALSERVPALRDSLVSVAVCMALALCLNDSGIVLPGMAAIMVVPLLEVLALRYTHLREKSARVHSSVDVRRVDAPLVGEEAGEASRCAGE